MVNVLIYIFAFFITIPIIATFIVFWLSVKRGKSKQKSVHVAVNWTYPLFFVAIVILFRVIFDIGIFSYLFIFLLTVLMIILFLQWKLHTDIKLAKALKVLVRVTFLVFLFLYICLLLIGLIQQIVSIT
ncbi:DUF3397 domain-containing protein [Oceanobacillus bengalensis]|uniref:DUF3397 domain-containing protein n=1 Tax=Oceanobacillus bengalensis TaxID=1435466 RepID=A0A494Z1G3_9BACI|nr:DUF3397 domain-containing protein [Oceanobacillus bengalensis]